MPVDIRNEQLHVDIDIEFVRRTAYKLLKILDLAEFELSILILDNVSISKLNKKYLGKDKSTDVLSFSMGSQDIGSGPGKKLLGDIVISAEMAKIRSEELKLDFKQELVLYLIHGILHILGYKDKKLSERKKMQRRQEKLLKQLGYKI